MAPLMPDATKSYVLHIFRSEVEQKQDHGGLFSIILGTVAGVIIVLCVLWGIFPQIRKRLPPKPSRTKFNDGSVLPSRNLHRQPLARQRAQTFPTHPAVCPPRPLRSVPRLVSKPSIVRTYNPRTETPFPSSPPHGDPIKLPAIYTPRPKSVANTLPSTCSYGLFSPAVVHTKLRTGLVESNYHTVPKASAASKSRHLPGSSTDFGDARNYILAVPEPLSYRSKPDTKPPKSHDLLQTQEIFDEPSSDSAKLLHPNKLFRTLKGQEIRSSECSSTSLHVDHRESDAAAATAKDVMQLVNNAIEEHENSKPTKRSGSHRPYVTAQESDGSGLELTSSAIFHRLESYKSLIGGQPPKLIRAGTISRPKTPVHHMMKVFNNEPDDQGAALCSGAHIPRYTSVSTLPALLCSSEVGSVSTPPSTPQQSISNLEMLPTPLHVKRTAVILTNSSPLTQQKLPIKPKSIAQLRQEAEMSRLRRKDTERSLKQRRSRRLQQSSRCQRPAPLKLKPTAIMKLSATSRKSVQRRSFSTFRDSLLSPLVKPKVLRASIPGSSVYSRDTKGFSIVKTPLSAEFPTSSIGSGRGNLTLKEFRCPNQLDDDIGNRFEERKWEVPDITTSPVSQLEQILLEPEPHWKVAKCDTFARS